MVTDGQTLLRYLDDKNINKRALASKLKMSRTNLYQLFESVSFQSDTIKALEKELNIDFEKLRDDYVNIYTIDEDVDTSAHEMSPQFKKTSASSQNVDHLIRIIEKQQDLLKDQHHTIHSQQNTINYLTTGQSHLTEKKL